MTEKVREGKTMNKSSSDLSFKYIKVKKIKALSSTILTTNVLMVARSCAKNTKEKSSLYPQITFHKKP